MKRIAISLLLLMVTGTSIRSQNIGIGTNSPGERLHVAGNIKSDTLKPGAIKLTSNAGQVQVSVFHFSTDTLIQTQVLNDFTGEASDFFGQSVTISETWEVIGSPADNVGLNDDQGSATVSCPATTQQR